MSIIKQNIDKLLEELPENVLLTAAAKTRSPREVQEAVDAGIHIIGQNYLQDAEAVIAKIGKPVPFHFIGHLQRNKVKKAVEILRRFLYGYFR